MVLFSSGLDSGGWNGLMSSGKFRLGVGKTLAGTWVNTCVITVFFNLFLADFSAS
ncbi:hypothetical protein NIES25_32480 [Nostoc linckia NIES-25]|nr:hypothetical protein NIES25_32480 [Nostoc linckia NIES-25]